MNPLNRADTSIAVRIRTPIPVTSGLSLNGWNTLPRRKNTGVAKTSTMPAIQIALWTIAPRRRSVARAPYAAAISERAPMKTPMQSISGSWTIRRATPKAASTPSP